MRCSVELLAPNLVHMSQKGTPVTIMRSVLSQTCVLGGVLKDFYSKKIIQNIPKTGFGLKTDLRIVTGVIFYVI